MAITRHWQRQGLGSAAEEGKIITRLRIVAICGQFRPLTGGTERQAAQLARTWAAHGHRTQVWTRRLEASHPRLEFEGEASLRRLGWASALRLGRVRRIEKLHFSLSLLARLIRFRRDYDVVIVHHALYPALVASYAKRITGRPLVIRSASTGVTNDFAIWGSLEGPVLSAFRSAADAIVVTNRQGDREAVARGFEKSRVHRIPNGLDPGSSPPLRPSGRTPRFAYVGGFRSEKRVDLLLRAWARAGAPGELLLAGDGPLRSQLQVLAQSLGISPAFLGNIEEPVSLLRDIDVFVLPSDAEGMSNALLEAMAAGCACIATYVGGNIDCLAPEAALAPGPGSVTRGSGGWLVPCGDESALALAMKGLATDPSAREPIGRSARARVVAEYAIEQTASMYLRLFQTLVP